MESSESGSNNGSSHGRAVGTEDHIMVEVENVEKAVAPVVPMTALTEKSKAPLLFSGTFFHFCLILYIFHGVQAAEYMQCVQIELTKLRHHCLLELERQLSVPLPSDSKGVNQQGDIPHVAEKSVTQGWLW